MALTKNELEKKLEQMIQKRSVKDPDTSTHTLIAHARVIDKPKVHEESKSITQKNILLIPHITN